MHVHSTFSDGKGSVRENISRSEQRGLVRLGCVDHVRQDTKWLYEFVEHIKSESKHTDIEIWAGVEAKILDTQGTLDVPHNVYLADKIYAADHQFPFPAGCAKPYEVRKMLQTGILSKTNAIEILLEATSNVIERYENVVLAHLFSILRKIRISEDEVPASALKSLAALAKAKGALIEIDERWKCPATRTLEFFRDADVPILISSDSHKPDTIGLYSYNLKVAAELSR